MCGTKNVTKNVMKMLDVEVRKLFEIKNVWNEICHKICDKICDEICNKYVTFFKEVPNNAKCCARRARRHQRSLYFFH